MKYKFTFIILFIFTSNIFAQSKWSLQKCIEYGFANNITTKQNQIQSDLAVNQITQGKNAFLPTINGTLSPSLSFGRSPVGNAYSYTTQSITNENANANISYTLYNGNQRRYNSKLYNLNWEIALSQNDKLKNDMALTIASYYLQTLLSKEQIDIARSQIKNSKAQFHNTNVLLKATLKSEMDVAELETQVAKDSLNISIAEETMEQNLLTLKNYLSLDPATLFDIETLSIDNVKVEPIENMDPEKIYAIALNNLPVFKINDLKLKAEELNIKIAKAAKNPTISFDLGLSSGYSQVLSKVAFTKDPFFLQAKNNFRQFINLNLTYTIFDAFRTRNNVARSKINYRGLEQNIEQDKLKLKQDIYKAYQDAKSSLKKFMVSKIGVTASERSLSIAEKKYTAGILNTIDLITNQNNLFKARQDYVVNQIDYIFKIKILQFYNGSKITF